MSAFSDICEKIITTANSEAHFSEARAERILEQFWVDFGTLFGGLGHPKWEKMRSKNDAKKRVAKKSREGVQVNPVSARAGRGCPINNPPGALFQPYGHSPRAFGGRWWIFLTVVEALAWFLIAALPGESTVQQAAAWYRRCRLSSLWA